MFLNAVLFCLLVGIISTLTLDVWVLIARRLFGMAGTSWGVVGQWLCQLPRGQITYQASWETPPGLHHTLLGWIFHYVVGIGYAVLLLLIWGTAYMAMPTVLPVIIVGILLSTLAGLMVLTPALGGGFLASAVPAPWRTRGFVLIAHAIFAAAQFGAAVLFAQAI